MKRRALLTAAGGAAAAIAGCLGSIGGGTPDPPENGLIQAGQGDYPHDIYVHNALDRADFHGLRSVAFPALSTGAFGYPLEEAADIATRAVLEQAAAVTAVQRIRFVLFDEDAARVHGAAIDRNLDKLREQRR